MCVRAYAFTQRRQEDGVSILHRVDRHIDMRADMRTNMRIKTSIRHGTTHESGPLGRGRVEGTTQHVYTHELDMLSAMRMRVSKWSCRHPIAQRRQEAVDLCRF